MTKTFTLGGVLGVTSGIVLTSFNEIHDVIDFFYPDIGLIGCCSVKDAVTGRILSQRPEFAGLIRPESFETDFERAKGRYGAIVSLTT